MNALNIVLVCVVSVFIFVVLVWIFGKRYMRHFFGDKKEDFKILDNYVPKNPTVLLGDSLTDFFLINEFNNEKIIVNRGIATNTIKNVEDRINEVINLNPKRVLLQIGINDLIQNGHKLQAEDVANRIISLANRLKEAGSEVIIISLYPINRHKMKMGLSKFICIHATNERIKHVNESLEAACQINQYRFINLFNLLVDDEGDLKKEYTLEGLHLSIKCYEVIYHEIKDLL